MQLKDGALDLPRELKPGEQLDIKIGFKSRGMSYLVYAGQGAARDQRLHADVELCRTCPRRG